MFFAMAVFEVFLALLFCALVCARSTVLNNPDNKITVTVFIVFPFVVSTTFCYVFMESEGGLLYSTEIKEPLLRP